MSGTRYASVLGLGFGDCGKGLFIDALARRWKAQAIVRFNGGAQAGHNVVVTGPTPSPPRHHTFSQFGAGTLLAGVRTVLVDPMIVHPTALLVEAEVLGRAGVTDALARLTIDEKCRLTTPFHQAAGRLRELLRGADAHGTCGVGVGETVRHALQHPGQDFRYGDLEARNAQGVLDRLQYIRETLRAEFLPQCSRNSGAAALREFRILDDEALSAKWLAQARALARHCPPASCDAIRGQLTPADCVLFEGAQGVLLDEWRGFHPHTTWSSINTAAVEAVAARFGLAAPVEHYGVLRAYLTRHGPGPLPTHDPSLDDLLPEPHNSGAGWQGLFRRGHPDAVLLRYALASAGPLTGLLISHLDAFQRGVPLSWCERYSISPLLPPWPQTVDHLPLSPDLDLDHQGKLTRLLQNARPQYGPNPIGSAPEFLERIAGVTALPVRFCSYGPAREHVREV